MQENRPTPRRLQHATHDQVDESIKQLFFKKFKLTAALPFSEISNLSKFGAKFFLKKSQKMWKLLEIQVVERKIRLRIFGDFS